MLVKEFVIDVGPELVDQPADASVGQRDGGAAHGKTEAAVAGRIIQVGKAAAGERAQNVGEVEAAVPTVSPGDKLLRQRVGDATLEGALPRADVARVFLEKHRIKEVCKKIAGHLISQRRAIALAVAGHALPVAGKLVLCLAQPGLES